MGTARAVLLAIVATLALVGSMTASADAKTVAQAALTTVNDTGGPSDGGGNDAGDPGFLPPDQ